MKDKIAAEPGKYFYGLKRFVQLIRLRGQSTDKPFYNVFCSNFVCDPLTPVCSVGVL